MLVPFCVITAANQNCITKEFKLVEGEVQRSTKASVYEGFMRVLSVKDPQGFADALMSLTSDQCLTYGLPPHDAELVTEQTWINMGRPDGPLPRIDSVFKWSSGPGVMMLDYDAPKDGSPPLSRKELLKTLLSACPAINEANLIWWPSTSSHIYAGVTEVNGLRGQRFYILVNDASDIERAGTALNERLWALGHGRYEVSNSGSLLKRPIFDGAVWQSNRIDFAAGAKCGDGLQQRRGKPFLFGAPSTFCLLDTREAIPELKNDEHRLARSNQAKAESLIKVKAEQVKDDWMAARAKGIKERNPHLNEADALGLARRAVDRRDLVGDWLITIKDERGTRKEITVLEALDHPETYHGCLTLDPLEPEYDGGRWVGKLYLLSVRPNLNSLAHGGVNFRLHRHSQRIELVTGKGREATDELLVVLRQSPDIFDFGGELVCVGHAGVLHPLDENSLRYIVGGMTQFWQWRTSQKGGVVEVLCDPPATVCKNVLSIGPQRALKKLSSVITAPTLRPDGSVLDTPGYDAKTQLLFDSTVTAPGVPACPTHAQALAALEQLWLPFGDFPFCGPLDRAVHLAALLTTAVRASLTSSPGFAYDAPIQGSGKTLLARCVGILAQGSDPSVWPHTAGRDDEETRKRVFSVLRTGARVLIWDNVVGVFDSPAMAACMTAPTLSDRILGQSVTSTVPNRLIVILTGNNITLKGEMPRRILVCRIDPQSEKPFARSFDLEPYSYCRDNRQSMLIATLTLIRAFLTHGCKTKIAGSLASFESWDAWVRRAVIYANELKPGMFGDVMDVVQSNQSVDPEQEAWSGVLSAWETMFGTNAITVAQLLAGASDVLGGDSSKKLAAALEALTNTEKRNLTAMSLGKFLGFRNGRISGGRVLEKGGKVDAVQTWRLKVV